MAVYSGSEKKGVKGEQFSKSEIAVEFLISMS